MFKNQSLGKPGRISAVHVENVNSKSENIISMHASTKHIGRFSMSQLIMTKFSYRSNFVIKYVEDILSKYNRMQQNGH